MINAIDAVGLIDKMNSVGGPDSLSLVNTQGNVASGASFEQILAKISGGLGASLNKAEEASVQKMTGHGSSISGAVNAIMEAERSLNTAIAIRDKIVQAYNEISRMQI
ncbi:MAG: flagellar hook-basal body complex protein FliE [Alphaproteobacteria bacterium]|nr:flagellar hook-basal body complex protein FliE [Alphaproteobacteria bacterium]